MEKHNYDAGLLATNAPFNLCVRYGDLIFISGQIGRASCRERV